MELKESSLQRFVYTCPLAFILTDANGKVEVMNGAAAALLMPWAEGGELGNLFSVLQPWDERCPSAVADMVGAGKVCVRRIGLGREGSPITHLEFRFSAFDTGFSVTCQDITEEVVDKERLAELGREEARQRGRAEMADVVLHDLGNALTGVGSCAVELRELVDTEGSGTTLERLASLLAGHLEGLDDLLGQGRGQGLVSLLRTLEETFREQRGNSLQVLEKVSTYLHHAHQLIDINRAYARPGEQSKASHDLPRLLADVVRLNGDSARQRGGDLRLLPGGPEPRVLVDRSRLMQVLINLVKNALEAGDAELDSPGVQVSISLHDQGDEGLLVLVEDDGPGFEPSQADSFFAAGFSTKQRGSGLGLFGCRRFVESFDGSLELQSDGPGQGARARLVLPREVVADDDSG